MDSFKQIDYTFAASPVPDCTQVPVMLTDETMEERLRNVTERMKKENLDSLIVYADLEHGSNFEYLTGFLPRFEEALLILHPDGPHYMVMGNENLNKVAYSRIKAIPIHAPQFSLPNQPMDGAEPMWSLLSRAGIGSGQRVGIAGWKLFAGPPKESALLFDIPYYIVDAVKYLVGDTGSVKNEVSIFIGEQGVRRTNNVNEIEHYEFGAALAGDRMLAAMDLLEEGVRETALGNALNALGQKNIVVTIAASGKRFVNANLYPTDRMVKAGDTISLTVGYKGGLSSRAGYAVKDISQLPEEAKDYIDVLAKPYFNAYVTWLEEIRCGLSGGRLYERIEQVLPKSRYHWSLCPGHLTADEEWLASPVYKGSRELLTSGMLFQIDILPSVKGCGGINGESTIALADEDLRAQIRAEAPGLWERICARRSYLKKELGIQLNPDVLPLASTVAYIRPFLLQKQKAMKVRDNKGSLL